MQTKRKMNRGNYEWIRRGRGIMLNNTRGMNHRLRKLNEDQVREIRRMIDAGKTNPEIAALYNVKPNCISLIRRRVNWRHIA